MKGRRRLRKKEDQLHSDEIQKIRELVRIRQKYRERWKDFCRQIEKYIIQVIDEHGYWNEEDKIAILLHLFPEESVHPEIDQKIKAAYGIDFKSLKYSKDVLQVGYLLSEQERKTVFGLRKEYYADYWENNLEANSNLNEYIAGLIKEKHLKNDKKTLLQLKNELPECMVKTDIQYMILKLNRNQHQER